jgi:hypothetical protein
LGFSGQTLEIIEEGPPEIPGTTVVIVFPGGEVETLEDPELRPAESGWGPRKERIA